MPWAVWLAPSYVFLAAGIAVGIAGIAALVATPHLGIKSAILALFSALAGGAVVTAFIVRSALPSIERTLAQHRLRASTAEEQYRSIFENAVEGIFQTTPEGRYLKANPMLAQIYGYNTPEELIVSLTDIGSQLYVDDHRRTEFRELLQSTDVVLNFDSQVRRRDGQEIWIRENARALRDTRGQLIGYEGTVLDITARKAAQEELAKSRKQERVTAARIQQTLLLADPPDHLPWFKIGVISQPSQAIDGDFYDFYCYDNDCIDVIIGDVMGKGIPAALLGAGIKSGYLRAVAQLLHTDRRTRLPRPEAVMTAMHNEMSAHFIGLEFFATVCYLRFDNLARTVTYVDCGHAKTIHCHVDGRTTFLESDCLPLGFSAKEIYKERIEHFQPGDLFLCYSDGVTEAQCADGEMFGLERLKALVEAHKDDSPQLIADQIKKAVMEYACADALGDDLTVIAIRVQ